jgi:endonuclease YncB( thermonuclease family)
MLGMRSRTGLFIFLGIFAVAFLALRFAAAPPPPPLAPVEVAVPPPAEAPPATPPPPAEPELPKLPEVTLTEHPIHVVPEDIGPAPVIGQPLDVRHPPRNAGQSQEVAQGPASSPLPMAPRQFSGAATATGGVGLQIGTVPVQLFGIKRAGAGDHCGGGTEADCGGAAQRALAKKLVTSAKVSCRVPNARPGVVIAFAICLDENGVDLGGYLVGEGLALADTGQSYDYVGAEGVAHSLRHGLWQFR